VLTVEGDGTASSRCQESCESDGRTRWGVYEEQGIESPSLCSFMGRPAPSCAVKVQ